MEFKFSCIGNQTYGCLELPIGIQPKKGFDNGEFSFHDPELQKKLDKMSPTFNKSGSN
jgi:hypothetical protein